MASTLNYGGMNNVYTQCSEIDDTAFMIRSIMGEINTVTPVRVMAVYANGSKGATGYVDVMPLVGSTDANGLLIPQAPLYHLPYLRLQGGVAAVVTDPVVGDIGLAVFTQSDSTNVKVGTLTTVLPGSFRKFSMSDGWYIGGFLNQKPLVFLELKQDGKADLTAQSGVTLNVNGGCTINANGGGCTINANTKGCTINANSGGCTINGNTTIKGQLTVSENVLAGNGSVTLLNHTHTGAHGETSKGHG